MEIHRFRNQTNSSSENSPRSPRRPVFEITEEHENETNSGPGSSQRNPQRSVIENGVRSDSEPPESRSQKFRTIVLAIVFFFDPLFLFLYMISGDQKCIAFDSVLELKILPILYLITIIILLLYTVVKDFRGIRDITIHAFVVLPITPTFVILPILPIFPVLLETTTVPTIYLVFGLIQFVARSVEALRRSITSTTSSSFYDWLFRFFYIYLVSSQMFGGLWYFMAVVKENDCARKSCIVHHEYCYFEISNCFVNKYETSKIYQFINDYCSTNTTNYDFGIFSEAHQTGILKRRVSFRKILYCFRWGLQNLSAFGQGLDPGTDIFQNIFVICIIFTAVMLFFNMVGALQVYMQYIIERRKEAQNLLQETTKWLHFRKLTPRLQYDVKNYYKKVWDKTKGSNTKNMLYNLPEVLGQQRIRELCIEPLQKVQEFRRRGELNAAFFTDLCNCVKSTSYDEYTNVMREGKPIDKMIFVLHGTLWIYRSRGTTDSPSTDHGNPRTDLLNRGDSCGEELVNYFQADPYTLDVPVSTRTIQAATKIQAFVLTAYDLKNIFIKHHESHIATQQASTSTIASSQ